MAKAVQIRVHGQVQGVFFRHNAQTEAKRLGLAGFARNDTDGTVYIEAEGSDEALNQFIDWCHEGSTSATVKDVEITPQKPQNHQDFRII